MAVVLCKSMAWVLVWHIRMVMNTDAFNPEAQLAPCSSQTSVIFTVSQSENATFVLFKHKFNYIRERYFY
jgi:hypothetical protein